MRKIVLLLLVLPFFAGCLGGYKCEEYPQFMSDYLPYYEGQMVSFENGKGDVMKFNISSCYSDQPDKIPINCKCTCEGMKEVWFDNLNVNDSIDGILMRFGTVIEKRDIGSGVILNTRFYLDSQGKNSVGLDYYGNDLRFDPYKDKNADKIPLVIDIPNGGGKISRVKIERGKGLVEFDDEMNNCTWRLVE